MSDLRSQFIYDVILQLRELDPLDDAHLWAILAHALDPDVRKAVFDMDYQVIPALAHGRWEVKNPHGSSAPP
jgi:hypothetical protein